MANRLFTTLFQKVAATFNKLYPEWIVISSKLSIYLQYYTPEEEGGGSKPPISHLLYPALPARTLHPPFSYLSSLSTAKYQASLCNLPLFLWLLILDLASRSTFSYLPFPGPPPALPRLLSPWCSRFYLNAKNFNINKETIVQYSSSDITLLYRRSIVTLKVTY